MEKRDRGLREFILTQIKGRGPVPFFQFMDWCLYHPEYGYYRSEGTTLGKEGDFYTSPSVHPLFGYLIAKQLQQMAEILGGPVFDIVEMGGGRGFLCEDVLTWMKRNAPELYPHLHYYLLEKTPLFLKEQKERLAHFEQEGRVSWIDSEAWEEGKERDRFEGCLLSNELVDAFPVHRVIVDGGILKEIYVAEQNSQLEERWGEISDSRIVTYLQSPDINLEEGQKAEVNLPALDWMERVGRCLKRGFVITIDYGYLAQELYAPHHRQGTLLCYFQHRTSEDPFERVGAQDMTSHVNFTALIRKGEDVGLRLTGLVPQYRFLLGLGILQEMESIGKRVTSLEGLRLRLRLKHLIEPEAGMGEIFKVLIQHKGVLQPQLDGLRELEAVPWPSLGERGIDWQHP